MTAVVRLVLAAEALTLLAVLLTVARTLARKGDTWTARQRDEEEWLEWMEGEQRRVQSRVQ